MFVARLCRPFRTQFFIYCQPRPPLRCDLGYNISAFQAFKKILIMVLIDSPFLNSGCSTRFAKAKKKPWKANLPGRKKKLGNDLLSHTLVCSTIGDEGLDFWVRYGIRYFPFSNITKQNWMSYQKFSESISLDKKQRLKRLFTRLIL
jgi:hypothetical protein